jgi:hypothetical protein
VGLVEATHRGYVPKKSNPNAVCSIQSVCTRNGADNTAQDKQGFKENQEVRIKNPKSSNIWLIDKAYLRGTHWKYVLKSPDDQRQVYNGGEEVEEIRLKVAG